MNVILKNTQKENLDLYGIMGHPIQHSWSPRIHQLFAEQTRQNLIYQAILVPLQGLAKALDHFQAKGGKGLNITLPFKQEAYQLVDTLSERAQKAKAINTILFNADGSRFGDNTDGIGFVRDVNLHHAFTILNKRILILGAGGAVRGILSPLLEEQPEVIVVANRTRENAEVLAKEFAVEVTDFADLGNEQFDLIINGTSASLNHNDIKLPHNIIGKETYCYDMVYGKSSTPFMIWAQNNQASIVSDGLGMLVEQAAESFYLWRQIRPDTQSVLNYFTSRHQ